MTPDDSTMVISSTREDEYDGIGVCFDHDDECQPHPHNFSRFSTSTSSIPTNDDDDMGMYMSRLSTESFDADADEEFSDKELLELSSDSDEETCHYSLPAIPSHRRNRLKEIKRKRKTKDGGITVGYNGSSFSGEREGMVVIIRPKGGRRSMCMDMEEVKACRELGFELEHEHISPTATWLISGPGDDPRVVKARLKVWAQAVALVSTSMRCS
ncbi:uncharacterized protein LOC120199465 [Hibiscus syriacus]|nr:uncharacterized protein LOC120199465 [Hibiscus syriacus]